VPNLIFGYKRNNVVLGSNLSKKHTEFASFLNLHEGMSEQKCHISQHNIPIWKALKRLNTNKYII